MTPVLSFPPDFQYVRSLISSSDAYLSQPCLSDSHSSYEGTAEKIPRMSYGLIEQVSNEWVSTYAQEHLKSFTEEGAALGEQQHWCSWLKANLPTKFQVHLMENRRFPTSGQTLKEWWEPWIGDSDTMSALVEEWREQYNWEKHA